MQIALDSERIDRSNNDAFASYVSRHTKPDDDEFRRRRPLPAIDQLSLKSKQIFHCLWDLGLPSLTSTATHEPSRRWTICVDL